MQLLNRAEFAVALKKGLGRAWLHVANYGLDDVADLVLEACLHKQSYDPQDESSRAVWLFEMFGQTSHYARFRESILDALSTETDTWDSQQLCNLAKEMAIRGDELARQAVKVYAFEKANDPACDDWLGAKEWRDLAGVEGVIDLARIYGQRLIIDPNDRPDYFWWTNETKQIYQAALLQNAQNDSAIQAYWEYLEARGVFASLDQPVDREVARQEARKHIRPINQILDDAKNGASEYPSYYTVFGRYATSDELEVVYNALLTATDDVARVRLLWVFRRASPPRLDDIIFKWAFGDNEDLREAALIALAQITDARIRTLASTKLTAGQLNSSDSAVLALFLHNYQSEDAQAINSAVVTIELEDCEDAHSWGVELINIAERHADPELAPALRWVYANTPCTLCRSSVVKLLDQFQALDDALLQECLHDAEEDTRAIARKQLER
ncbi:hypothetical protein TFLX_01912 [Thermoflexales bacterium]|nr:hypothetical protein TFLX_01912 [Thermoflexales bacterium]